MTLLPPRKNVPSLSEEYRLNKIAEHLQRPIDTWFDWSEYQREDYDAKFNAMSVDDAIQGKAIRVAQDLKEIRKSNEYKELSADVAVVLKENKKYKNELVTAVMERALELLNHPTAISKKGDHRPLEKPKVLSRLQEIKTRRSRVYY